MIKSQNSHIIKKKYYKDDNIKKIAILADCGCVSEWESTFPQFLDYVWKKHTPDLFFIIGDLVPTGAFSEYKTLLKYISLYPAKWIAVPGNHDRPLLSFCFFFGNTTKIADTGKWRFLCINTAYKRFFLFQKILLKRHIRKNTIILSHIPPRHNEWEFYSLSQKSTKNFFDLVLKNKTKIKAAFFGHIHGFSEQFYNGIPMIVTGGAARSKSIRNNRYNESAPLEMILFDVNSGKITVEKNAEQN